MSSIAQKKCIPCDGGVPPLNESEKLNLLKQINPEWKLINSNNRLYRKLNFKDFSSAMKCAIEIGRMADEQWHHPELSIGFGHLGIEVWTHKIDSLVESDFIFCSKADEIINNHLP